MSGQDKSIPKKMGRPPTGEGKQIQVRIHPEMLADIDAWIAAQPDPKPGRPEAIRHMIRVFFGSRPGG